MAPRADLCQLGRGDQGECPQQVGAGVTAGGACPSISKAVGPAGGLQLGLAELCFTLGLKDPCRACELTQGAWEAVLLVAGAGSRDLGIKHVTVQAAASWLCLCPSEGIDSVWHGGFVTCVTAKWMWELPGAEQVSACLEELPLGVGLPGRLTNSNNPALCLPPKKPLSPPATIPSPPSPLFITAFLRPRVLGDQKLGIRAWLALKHEASRTLDALEKHQRWHWLPACLSLQMVLPLLLLPPPRLGSSMFPLGAATSCIRPSFSFSPQLQMSCWIFLWEDAIWLPDLFAFTLA